MLSINSKCVYTCVFILINSFFYVMVEQAELFYGHVTAPERPQTSRGFDADKAKKNV